MVFTMRLFGLLLCVLLSACANNPLRDYPQEVGRWQAAGEVSISPAKRDALAWLENGEIAYTRRRFAEAQNSWQQAEAKLEQQQEEGRSLMDKGADALSWVVNDKIRSYQVPAFEQVLLQNRLAMAAIAQQDWDGARLHVRRAHEHEEKIRELYQRREQALREKSEKQSFASLNELGGYPVETLNDPAVLALRNSYETPLTHYLAGFVYEALGEGGLAAAGYRHAVELAPENPQLQQALAGLDARLAPARNADKDVLLLIETGTAPRRVGQQVNLPVFYTQTGVGVRQHWMSVSFPVLRSAPPPQTNWLLGQQNLDVQPLLQLDVLARRQLKDDLPWLIARTSVRAAARLIARQAVEKVHNNKDAPLAGLLAGVAMDIGGLVLEQADERSWISLPGHFQLVRLALAPGPYTLQSPQGQTLHFVVGEQNHQLINIAQQGGQLQLVQGVRP